MPLSSAPIRRYWPGRCPGQGKFGRMTTVAASRGLGLDPLDRAGQLARRPGRVRAGRGSRRAPAASSSPGPPARSGAAGRRSLAWRRARPLRKPTSQSGSLRRIESVVCRSRRAQESPPGPSDWAPAPFWCPLARTSAHIDAHPRTSRCAERRPSVPGGPPLHTREVAGSKPAAPMGYLNKPSGLIWLSSILA